MAVSNRIHYMIYTLRWVALCILVSTAFLYVTTRLLAQEGSGLLCVAPLPKPVCSADGCLSGAQGFSCASGNASVKVDSRKPVPLPKEESMSLTGLALTANHRVVLLCDGKPKESFKFRFSELPFERASAKKDKACLFVNDLYGWVQLMPLVKPTPWCKCKQ